MDEATRNRFFSSDDQSWATPQPLFDRFNQVFDFKLDPCCSHKTAKCKAYYTEKDNGLEQDWYETGNTFVNPPFSRELKYWIQKSYIESTKGIIVADLIPARPDTYAWHTYCLPYAKILFIKGRITFEDQSERVKTHKNPAFFPSALVVFGNTTGYGLYRLNDLGTWVEKVG